MILEVPHRHHEHGQHVYVRIELSLPGENAVVSHEGIKDTVISYPGEITRVKATFDRAGQLVWHCHILEHEDNERMRPYTGRTS